MITRGVGQISNPSYAELYERNAEHEIISTPGMA